MRVELTPLAEGGGEVSVAGAAAGAISEARKLANLVGFLLGLGVGVEGQAVSQLPGDVLCW